MQSHDVSAWALLGLGAYHGLNPGMGWLFAVALGMQEGSRRAVWQTLLPLGLGHALAIAAALAVAAALGAVIPLGVMRWLTATVLIGFGIYKLIYARHPRWGSMRIGFRQLTFWSFLMASAHGAGLMLLPLVMRDMDSMGGAAGMSATFIHTAGYLAATGVAAVLVYEKFGVGFIRRGWFNVDVAWSIALLAAGVASVAVA